MRRELARRTRLLTIMSNRRASSSLYSSNIPICAYSLNCLLSRLTKTDKMSVLSRSQKHLPLSFKQKLLSTQDQLGGVTSQLERYKTLSNELTSMWTTLQPLYEFGYNEAVADNGKYEINLKIPELPHIDLTVQSMVKYVTISLYVQISVSHCKSLMLDGYVSSDVARASHDVGQIEKLLAPSLVPDISISDHILGIQKLFTDELGMPPEDPQPSTSTREQGKRPSGKIGALVLR